MTHRKAFRGNAMYRALSIVVNEGRQLKVPLQTRPAPRATKTCPHCQRELYVDRDFGMRLVGNKPRPQSWCRDCRSASDRRGGVQLELLAV